jgi:hypothetical protein
MFLFPSRFASPTTGDVNGPDDPSADHDEVTPGRLSGIFSLGIAGM